jgi:hypothetical protein
MAINFRAISFKIGRIEMNNFIPEHAEILILWGTFRRSCCNASIKGFELRGKF